MAGCCKFINIISIALAWQGVIKTNWKAHALGQATLAEHQLYSINPLW